MPPDPFPALSATIMEAWILPRYRYKPGRFSLVIIINLRPLLACRVICISPNLLNGKQYAWDLSRTSFSEFIASNMTFYSRPFHVDKIDDDDSPHISGGVSLSGNFFLTEAKFCLKMLLISCPFLVGFIFRYSRRWLKASVCSMIKYPSCGRLTVLSNRLLICFSIQKLSITGFTVGKAWQFFSFSGANSPDVGFDLIVMDSFSTVIASNDSWAGLSQWGKPYSSLRWFLSDSLPSSTFPNSSSPLVEKIFEGPFIQFRYGLASATVRMITRIGSLMELMSLKRPAFLSSRFGSFLDTLTESRKRYQHEGNDRRRESSQESRVP